MPQRLANKTFSGVIWSSLERFSTQGISLILGILIARQLTPDDYGTIALLSIFFGICNTFVDSGFSRALIRKIDRTESDNSTVFYFNILIGFIASLLFFLSAPAIASFFNIPLLIPIVRILSLTIFIGSFGAVQQALLTAKIDFKTQAKVSLTTALISGLSGLLAAYNGLGVWALVIQMVVSSVFRSALLWLFTHWYPTMPFSKSSFKELFGFGSKLLLSGLLDITYNNIFTLVIGKFFSPSALGNYSRASQYAQFPSSNLTEVIQKVTYPVLSQLQNQDDRLAASYRKLLKTSAFVIFPLMIGLAALAEPIIYVLLTSKWMGAAPYLQIICFALMWYPIHSINLNLLQVKGRSELFLRLEIIKKTLGVVMLGITLPLGVLAMCYGQVLTSLLCLVVNTHYTGKLLNVGFFIQMKDILPALIISLTMGVSVTLAIKIVESPSIQLILGITSGAICYLSLALVFRLNEIVYIKDLIKGTSTNSRNLLH